MHNETLPKATPNSAPEGLFVFDRRGSIVYVNSQLEELFGYDPGELIGQNLEVLVPDFFRARGDRAPAEKVGMELKGFHKDRSEILLQVSVASVANAEQPLACCVVRMSPVAGEASPKELSAHFRQMVENSHDILTIRDAHGRVRYTSPAIESVLGYKQAEMVGSVGFELVHPEDRPNVENALQEFWKKPGARGSLEYRARHANGTWVSLEVVAYNLLDDPEIQGVVINGRDISKRKQENAGKDQLIAELQETLTNLKTLSGVLPICASCKSIHDGEKWRQIEAYIRDRSQIEFSHTICPECTTLWYPEMQKN
jgi:PAS domain S-box-containing protein